MSKYIGKIFTNNTGFSFKILEKESDGFFKIKFCQSGFKRSARIGNIVKGEVKDLLQPSIYSVGFVGGFKHKTTDFKGGHNPYYSCWKRMINRCYNKNYRCWEAYGGRGVIVCEKWHNFQNFAEWCVLNYTVGFELDKDLLDKKGLLYSESTCVFLPQPLNKCLSYTNTSENITGFKGVSLSNRSGLYSASVSLGGSGVKDKVGFVRAQDAHLWYKTEKELYVKSLLRKYFYEGAISEEVFKQGLMWEVTNVFLETK